MRKIKFGLSVVLTIAVALSLASVGTTLAQGKPNRVIVTFAENVNNESAKQALEKVGAVVVRDLPSVKAMAVVLPDKASEKALQGGIGVLKIEEDVVLHVFGKGNGKKPPQDPPTQPVQTLEWGVDRINAEFASGTGVGVRVAVIDTGIDATHPDLVNNVKGGVNFVAKGRRGADPNAWADDNGHGSHVAGIIAAEDNTIGVVGVAPQAQLYAIKSLDRNGNGYLSDIIAGLEWAVANDMNVVNMSLGTSSDIQTLHNAVDVAYSAGVVLVAASGNSGDGNLSTNNVEYPAKYDSVIAVGATDINDLAPYWSSDGAEVELAAPGVVVRSTYKGGTYATMSGTSMASPHVAGVVALILQNQSLTPAEIRNLLQATADDLGSSGHDVLYGYGLVDALLL